MQETPNTNESHIWQYLLLSVGPLLLLWGILSMSPNFDFAHTQYSFPLGGDYLQEYVGGKLINDDNAKQLYDLNAFQKAQHNDWTLGFEWDQQQYFPPVYPPFWYAAVSPLSHLEYAQAAHIWAGLMTVCLIVSLVLIYRFTDAPLLLPILLCLSTPVIHSISSGQKGTLLLMIFTISFVLLRKFQPAKSGVVFALSLFKPYLGVCIGLLMLVSGRWKWVAATLLTVAAIVAGTAVTWPDLSQNYIKVCLGFGDYVRSSGYDLGNSFSLWSGWQLLLTNGTSAKVMTGISTLVVLLGSLICLRPLMKARDKNHQSNRWEIAFAIMIMVMAATAPHFYYYDLTVLILPAAIFAGHAKGKTNDRRRQVVLIPAIMFGCSLLIKITNATNIPAGAIFLLAAIFFSLYLVVKTEANQTGSNQAEPASPVQ